MHAIFGEGSTVGVSLIVTAYETSFLTLQFLLIDPSNNRINLLMHFYMLYLKIISASDWQLVLLHKFHLSTVGSSSTLLAHHLSECGAIQVAILARIYSTSLDTVGTKSATIIACLA